MPCYCIKAQFKRRISVASNSVASNSMQMRAMLIRGLPREEWTTLMSIGAFHFSSSNCGIWPNFLYFVVDWQTTWVLLLLLLFSSFS